MLQQEVNQALDACNNAVSADPKFALAQNNLRWATQERQKITDELAADEKLGAGGRTEAICMRDGLDYLHLGDYDRSIGAFKEAMALDPKNAVAANNIGLDYMLELKYGDAVPWFEKAAALDPTMQLAKNNLAWAQGELARAGKKTP
jgi:tetratricopeptide (TPR) repeat protein